MFLIHHPGAALMTAGQGPGHRSAVGSGRPQSKGWQRNHDGCAADHSGSRKSGRCIRDLPPGVYRGRMYRGPVGKIATAVLHVGRQNWATEKAVVERVVGHRPGARLVEANPVAQTATVTFDTAQTSVAELRRCVCECGFRSVGQSVRCYICDPLAEPDPADGHAATPAADPQAAETANPSRSPPRRSRPVTCCWSGPATRSLPTGWWRRARARLTSRW